jgi:poly(hydroxyalkanoate) depolymerase family esterase
MRESTPPEMVEALRLTRAGRLGEATALIQRCLGGSPAAAIQSADPGTPHGVVEVPDRVVSVDPGRAPRTRWGLRGPLLGAGVRVLRRLPAMASAPSAPAGTGTDIQTGGRFIADSYTAPAGTRGYKLYVPSGYAGQAAPLVVMLHGCTQTADDSAAGTRLNGLAEQETWLVVYPEQASSANPSRCWNWFETAHQRRGEGEPSLIAGITQQVMATYRVDPDRVYVAGMSAGGAMAAIMGATYPDLFAAVGVHSGLASGAAHDLRSAFAAMRRGKSTPAATTGAGPRLDLPLIVFHGDRDATVHPRNGEHVLAQAVPLSASEHDPRMTVTPGQVPGGHAYTRTVYHDATAQVVGEHWLVHGAGHAWSGGSPAGSYTDPHGPDAAREMLRFFREHPKRTTPP